MPNYGSKIAELRKKGNLTQAELGQQLNLTAQAVSKWENGLSEPDLETIHKICDLFNVSVDEFLETNISKQTPVPQVHPEQKSEPEKKTFGFCEKCSKPVFYGEYKIMTTSKRVRHGRHHHTETQTHLYCNDCYEKELKLQKEKAEQEAKARKETAKREKHERFMRGIKWGIFSAVILGIILALCYSSDNVSSLATYIIVSVIAVYGIFEFIAQCFWDCQVFYVFMFFCRSFKMPGIIFSFDLDGIISLILIKLTLSILSTILSIFLCLMGVAIATAIGFFTFPFALKDNKG